MAHLSSSEKIAEALTEALMTAADSDIEALGKELEEFKTRFFRSYQGVRQQPFARHLIDAIDEAVRFNKEMNGN